MTSFNLWLTTLVLLLQPALTKLCQVHKKPGLILARGPRDGGWWGLLVQH